MTTDQTDADLPLARLRMRTGMPVLDRGQGEVQLGTDPRWALRLAGLEAAEVAWLRELATRRHTSPVAAAARLGVEPERCEAIAAVLSRGGFLLPADPGGTAAVRAVGNGAADAPALGALRPDGAGRATLARRARAAVAVTGPDGSVPSSPSSSPRPGSARSSSPTPPPCRRPT
ncbi:hypothetical protein [Xylanimonas allomyrinae]|uniref:hypothetical protein n=1 Tax=Xylanimonas allomyrinae TaxID=2509459 RepID=UPI001FE8E5D8|nr:hypothetical protein [Xylanimonas allomyrinae]